MERRLQLLDSFLARGSDGATYKVKAYEHLAMPDPALQALGAWEPTGQAEYRLDDGRLVTVHSDDTMEIADTGVQLEVPARH